MRNDETKKIFETKLHAKEIEKRVLERAKGDRKFFLSDLDDYTLKKTEIGILEKETKHLDNEIM